MTSRKTTSTGQENTMPLAPNAVVALAPVPNEAAYLVFTGERHESCPVVAWAAVVDGYDDNGHALTRIEPTLLVDGKALTETAVRDTYGPDSIIVRANS